MQAIVLAGGRGKRMGILTQNTQKAALYLGDNPLIIHILNGLLREPSVSNIVILTGYRGEDIRRVINNTHRKLLHDGTLTILDFPQTRGTLSRLIASLPCLKIEQGCYVCGIDSLIPTTAFRRFCSYVDVYKNDVVLALSPRISIATTHKLACVIKDEIMSYVSLEQSSEASHEAQWCTDVGIRYLPHDIMMMLNGRDSTQERYIPSFIQELLSADKTVRGFVFEEDWKHFANINDLYSNPPLT